MPSDRGARDRLWPDLVGALLVAVAFAFATLLAMGIIGPAGSDGAAAPGIDVGLDLDVGEVSDSAVEECISDGFADSIEDVDVTYAVLQVAEEGTAPTLLLRNASGDVRLCDMFGPNPPASVPQPVATPAQPAVYFTNDIRRWECETKDSWDSFAASVWLAVTDPVAMGQLRFVVDGHAGDWFTSEARNGFVHLQGWARDLPLEGRVQMEVRVLDEDGDVVASEGLGQRRVRIDACDGSDIIIG